MWLAEVDENGYVVKIGIRNIDKENYVFSGENHRLVVDPAPLPTEYERRFFKPVKVQPVIGDTIEYKFERIPMEVISPDEQAVIDNALEKAKEFLDSKGIDSSHLFYFVTVHNADTGQDIAMAFTSGIHGTNNVKVSLLTNSVSEWYEFGNFIVNGVTYEGVSKDLETGAIIDKYRRTAVGQEKTTPDGKIVMTYPYETAPADPAKTKLLDEFKYRENITGWSDKENGFIIQYDRLFKKRE